MVCFVTLDIFITLKLTLSYGLCKQTNTNKSCCESMCSERPMEAPSMFGVPISTMSPCFVLPSPLGPRFLMAAGSQHCVWGWPGPAACVQGVGYSIDVHYCIQN